MPALADRVKETSTTTGTGNLTLAGAATNFQTFNTAIGQNIPLEYAIVHQSASEWEVGVGYLSGSSTLVRDQVRASTNSNALVSLSAGTKDVFVTRIASEVLDKGVMMALRMNLAGN